jgi:hypothetical protein
VISAGLRILYSLKNGGVVSIYLFFVFLLTCVYNVWATTTSAPLPSRTCSALLFSDFVEEKT